MKIYFIRHGETTFNKAGRIMGQLDEPLDAEGIEQSRRLAAKIDPDFERLFCSPLQRAKQTAQIINEKLKLPEIEYRQELRERNFGSLAGKTLEQMDQQTLGQISIKDQEQSYDYRPFGGESVQDVKARLEFFLNFLRRNHSEKKVLAVTHTGIIRLIYLIILHQNYPKIDNDSVHIFEI